MASKAQRIEKVRGVAQGLDEAGQVPGNGGVRHTAQRAATAAKVGGPWAAGGVIAYDGAKAAYQNPNVRRGMKKGTKVVLGAMALTALAVSGSIAGCTDSVLAAIKPDKSLSVGGGQNALKEIFINPLKMSPGGYVTSITGYKAQWSQGKFGVNAQLSETWNNDVKAEVWVQTGNKLDVPYNKDTHQYELTLPKDGWSVTLSSIDTQDTFTADGNKLGQVANAGAAFAKVLGFNAIGNYTNDIYGNLQGLARAGAYSVTQDACGTAAYPHLKPYIQDEFAGLVSSLADSVNPSLHITSKDVKVNLPDEVKFSSDYDGVFSGYIASAKENGMTINYGAKPVCRDLPHNPIEN